jgi:uncharacterized protein (DUF983 family)
MAPPSAPGAASENRFMTGFLRGLRRRCPNCGKGDLFKGYLKVRPLCPNCGHDNARYRADDAPPYFTILIVGHLVIAPMLMFSFIWKWPIGWVLLSTLVPLALITLGLLPLVKGAVIGAQWAMYGRPPPVSAKP